MAWWNFARKGSDVAEESPKPVSAAMYTDYAVQQLIGFITRIPDIDMVLIQAGINRSDLRKLETDDEIFQALRTRRDAVVATPWRIEPGIGNVTEFLIEELTPHIVDLVSSAWKAVPYGFNIQEVIYKKHPDGKIGIARITEKPINWFEPQQDGSLKYYAPEGMAATGEVVDTTYKFLLTRHDASYVNPYGEAILSRLYWPWFFRFNAWRFWGQFLERFGTPLLVGKSVDPKLMAEALLQAHQDAVVAHGLDDSVTTLESSREGQGFVFMENAIIMRIEKLILGQTLTSGSGGSASGGSGGGSYALGVIHNTVRDDLRKADLRMLVTVVQHLVNALCALNFPTRVIPKFVFEDNTGLEVDRANRDKILWSMGVHFTKQYYTDRYDLTDTDFDIDKNAHKNPLPTNPNATDGGSGGPQNTPKGGSNTSTQPSQQEHPVTGAPKRAPKAAKEGSVK